MLFAVITRMGRSIQTTAAKLDEVGADIVREGDAIVSVLPIDGGAGVVKAQATYAPPAEEMRSAVGAGAVVTRQESVRAVTGDLVPSTVATVHPIRKALPSYTTMGLFAIAFPESDAREINGALRYFESLDVTRREQFVTFVTERMQQAVDGRAVFERPEEMRAFAETSVRLSEMQARDERAEIAPGTVDTTAEARVKADRAALEAAGLRTADTVYAEGARVNAIGVENARKERARWEKLPLVGEACARVAAEVRAEERRDVNVVARSVKDASACGLTRLGMNVEGRLIVEGDARRYALSKTAMTQLLKRIGPAGGGGAQYLAAVDPELRALNVNRLLAAMGKAGTPNEEMYLRLRNRGGADECFAIVSERYNALDIDRVAEIVGGALPESMRAEVDYDGARLRVEATAHSNVAPEEYAAGETFKVGVTIRTDDTGRGGLRVDGIAVRNLCLNLIILDHASKPLARVTHLADARAIADALRKGMDEARKLVKPFLAQWGMACGRDEVTIARAAYGKEMPMRIEDAIPGFYRALFGRSDTDRFLPVGPGKAIEGVMAAWQKEPGTTRASLANAVTRWGHERDGADGFALEDVATVANRILWARTDRPLAWIGEGGDK